MKKLIDFAKKPLLYIASSVFVLFTLILVVVSCLPGGNKYTYTMETAGVSMEVIDVFLKNGRLEIPEGSKFFIKCEKCGCALRFGRFCYDCTKELVGQLNVLMFEQMGEQPKNKGEHQEKGKMRFIDTKDKRH